MCIVGMQYGEMLLRPCGGGKGDEKQREQCFLHCKPHVSVDDYSTMVIRPSLCADTVSPLAVFSLKYFMMTYRTLFDSSSG